MGIGMLGYWNVGLRERLSHLIQYRDVRCAVYAAERQPWRCRGTANGREWTRMGGGELVHSVGECAVAGVDELGHSHHSCSFAVDFFRAEGPIHTSPGQRPGKQAKEDLAV